MIYIIKENRTYDQIFGDSAWATAIRRWRCTARTSRRTSISWRGNSACSTISTISGEVSGDGHVWSNGGHHQRLHREDMADRVSRRRAHLRFRGHGRGRLSRSSRASRCKRAGHRIFLDQHGEARQSRIAITANTCPALVRSMRGADLPPQEGTPLPTPDNCEAERIEARTSRCRRVGSARASRILIRGIFRC